jgi:putative nucleotidyltransferase with HDIG domain
MSEQTQHYLLPEQLCVGLYIHLDLPWIDHPFTFSSFQISSDEQIAALRGLGLERIEYFPERSTSDPLPIPAPGETAPEPVADTRMSHAALAEKRLRQTQLAEQRRRVLAYEHEYLLAGQAVKTITRNVFSRPMESHQEAETLVGGLADSLITDKDVAVNLMPERVSGEETYQHALNVTILSLMLAKELGLPHEALVTLGVGALFHDIGKAEIPSRILLKQGVLTRAETAAIQEHVGYGVNIGKRMNLSQEALDIIAQHHEMLDGSGYPHKLSGAQLGELAKIVAITNTYDNLCNPAHPSQALSPHEALAQMYAYRQNHYEASAIAALVRSLGVYPPGTLLLLNQEVFGLVVSVNVARPLRPIVQIYDPNAAVNEPVLINLAQLPDLIVTRTLRPAQLPRSAYERLAPRKRCSYYFDASDDPVISATLKDSNGIAVA